MPHHVRQAQCLFWLALASVAIIALDGRPARPMAIPALAHLAAAGTTSHIAAGDTGDVVSRRIPIELVAVDGVPLTYAERDSIVRFALSLVGSPYSLGGTSPARGFDCSGLVAYVLSEMNMRLPRRAYEQARVGDAVERSQLRPGDLLTFGRDSVSHVGIYIGEGRFIHASSVAHRVVVSPLDRPASALIRPLRGARRLLVMGPSTQGSSGG